MRLSVPWLLVLLVPLVVCGALWWPVPLHLGTMRPLTAFSDSHVWVFEHLWRALVEGRPIEPTCAAGYPTARSFRPIAGVPAAAWLALRPLLGPLAAANLVQLLALPLSSAAAFVFLRRLGVAARVGAPLAVTYALCPNLLGTLATGEISNTQAWIVPVYGLALLLAQQSWWGLLAVAGAGLLAAVTSPYLALALPLLAGVAALAAWAHPALRNARVRLSAAVPALGLGLAPAWLLYQADRAGGGASVFRPARANPLAGLELPHPPPVATLDSLLWHTARPPGSPYETLHVATLGVPLLLAAGAGVLLTVGRGRGPSARRGVAVGIGVLVVGVVLALGPWVGVGDHLLTLGGNRVPTPVAALEALGWPTRMGGLYFRYSVVAAFGAVVVAGAGLPGSPRAVGALWLLCALNVAQGVHASGPLWPRPSAPVLEAAHLAEIAGSDGAVLELPLQGPTDAQLGQAALLRSVVHRRPTSALPRSVVQPDDPTHRLWRDATRGSDGARARAQLREAGVRYVVLPAALSGFVTPSRARIDALLGQADLDGELIVWDLGPTVPQCVEVTPPTRRPPRHPRGR